jgi:hypothetical protein
MELQAVQQRKLSLKALLLCLAFMLLFIIKSSPGFALDHFFILNYEGSKTCRVCHPDEVDDVTHSIHYRLLGDVQGVFDMFSNKPITGQWGKGNRY